MHIFGIILPVFADYAWKCYRFGKYEFVYITMTVKMKANIFLLLLSAYTFDLGHKNYITKLS